MSRRGQCSRTKRSTMVSTRRRPRRTQRGSHGSVRRPGRTRGDDVRAFRLALHTTRTLFRQECARCRPRAEVARARRGFRGCAVVHVGRFFSAAPVGIGGWRRSLPLVAERPIRPLGRRGSALVSPPQAGAACCARGPGRVCGCRSRVDLTPRTRALCARLARSGRRFGSCADGGRRTSCVRAAGPSSCSRTCTLSVTSSGSSAPAAVGSRAGRICQTSSA